MGLYWQSSDSDSSGFSIEAETWADSCSEALNWCFGRLFAPGSTPSFEVEIVPPGVDQAQEAFHNNYDLRGSLRITWQVQPEKPLELSVPLPYNGVFVSRRQGSTSALLSVWSNWLGEAPGFRLVRPTSLARRDQVEWRVGLPRGYFVGSPLADDLPERVKTRLANQSDRFFCESSLYPDWLRSALGVYVPKKRENAVWDDSPWKMIHETVVEHCRAHDLPVSDQEDLNHRALITFPVWLKGRLCDLLISTIVQYGDLKRRTSVSKALQGTHEINEGESVKFWEELVTSAPSISERLVPLHRIRLADGKAARRLPHFQHIDPLNPVDLLARVTRVKRLMMKTRDMAEIPAEYRQNHPSFRGRICPVESPESELVGLQLQLARGAHVDVSGRIHASSSDNPADDLGFGANLIPFFEHNDGARNMMGAKNLRQAVPVKGRVNPRVLTGGERSVQEFVAPLIQSSICPPAVDKAGDFALGVDLLVAYMPWMGLNFEDAIVVSQEVADKGLLDICLDSRYSKSVKPGFIPASLEELTIFDLEDQGLARVGSTLNSGSLIASFKWEGGSGEKRYEVRYTDRSPALVKSIRFTRGAPWMSGLLEYELERQLKLTPGDKLMGRHGNKGVVGAILPPSELPRLPDSDKLPAHLRGRSIDVILNPHGVISRMNLGQLLETHIGWLLHSGTCTENDIGESNRGKDIGEAFRGSINHEQVKSHLEKSGLDQEGRIQLVLPNGEATLSPVVVGFQHIVRLRHVPELKAQARRGGQNAAYSRRTGQAIHGRNLGGGQRVGEMEIWALAAHNVDALIAEMLGVKADASTLLNQLAGKPSYDEEIFQGFGAVLRDWLRTLLIDVSPEDGRVAFKLTDSEKLMKSLGPEREIKSPKGLRRLVNAKFICISKRKTPCEYALLDGDRVAVNPPVWEKGSLPSLHLRELLEHFGLYAAGPVEKSKTGYSLPLVSIATGKADGCLDVELTMKSDQLKATLRNPASPDSRPSSWPDRLAEVYTIGRFSKKKAKGNVSAEEMAEELLRDSGSYRIADLRVVCPHHQSIALRGSTPFSEIYRAEYKGLSDPRIVGDGRIPRFDERGGQWGFIKLPIAIPYPIRAYLGPKEKVESFLGRHGVHEGDIQKITCIPVPPLRYRMPLLMSSDLIEDKLNRSGYERILQVSSAYTNEKDEAKRKELAEQLEEQVRSLFTLLADGLKRKHGLIRKHGLGRRVDRSARLVVVPNPAHKWDEVGVPSGVLLELLGDEVEKWLKSNEDCEDLFEALRMAELSEVRDKIPNDWTWWKSSKDEELLVNAKEILEKYLHANPDVLVLLNRQPSLHRDSFQAFRPVPLGPECGDVVQLCPLACKGFGADFDGDEIVIHIPLKPKAREDAKKLLPSRNLSSLADGKALAHFDQDIVLGTYWLSKSKGSMFNVLSALLPDTCCRELIDGKLLGKPSAIGLLQHLVDSHPNEASEVIWQWMNLAFDCCSKTGVSYGFYDIALFSKETEKSVNSVLKRYDKCLCKESPDGTKLNDEIQEVVIDALHGRLQSEVGYDEGGVHFAAMAISGARGQKQTRQIVGSRGYLTPGLLPFDSGKSRFVFTSNLSEGMSPDEAFYAAMNARSSMCDKKLGTGHAGNLTRHLVFALWPSTVVSNDCGSRDKKRSILTCKEECGCCAKCHGVLPDGIYPDVGYQVGLVAAQSIGERGTQLSMQSFHSGEKGFSIADARSILEDKENLGYFESAQGASIFIGKMKDAKAYQSLLDVHFQILWKAIHCSPERTLRSLIQSHGPVTRIAFQRQARELLSAVLENTSSTANEPAVRVLFSLFAHRENLLNGSPS